MVPALPRPPPARQRAAQLLARYAKRRPPARVRLGRAPA